MTSLCSTTTLQRVIAGALLSFASGMSAVAFAGDSTSPPQQTALPGVAGDYRIARPAPAPESEDALPGNGVGTFKIGNTDVRISGSITVDVAAGGFKPPR